MAEVKTPLIRLQEGETFTADEDGAWVIVDKHSHSDIIRYVIADIGRDDAVHIAQTCEADD